MISCIVRSLRVSAMQSSEYEAAVVEDESDALSLVAADEADASDDAANEGGCGGGGCCRSKPASNSCVVSPSATRHACRCAMSVPAGACGRVTLRHEQTHEKARSAGEQQHEERQEKRQAAERSAAEALCSTDEGDASAILYVQRCLVSFCPLRRCRARCRVRGEMWSLVVSCSRPLLANCSCPFAPSNASRTVSAEGGRWTIR
jgi:hypothetical protein